MYRYPFGQTRCGRQWRAPARAATPADQTSAAPRDNTPLPRVLSAAANRKPVSYGLRHRSVGCVFVPRPRLLSELRRPPDDRARSTSRRPRAPTCPGSTMGPEPSLRASLSACLGSPPLRRGARGLRAGTAWLLPEAGQCIGSSGRPHGYGHGHPALWWGAQLERALPHAGRRRGLRSRARRLAFLRSRESAHRRGSRHPARCHSSANPAPTICLAMGFRMFRFRFGACSQCRRSPGIRNPRQRGSWRSRAVRCSR